MSALRRPPTLLFPAAVLMASLLCPSPVSAAFEVAWPDARSAAVLERGTIVSCVLSGRGASRVTFSGGELFGVREAAGGAVVAEGRWLDADIGVSASRLGGALYEERTIGAAVGWSPEPELRLALAVRCPGLRARGVEDRWSVAFDAGMSRRLLGRVVVSARGENLTHAEIGGSPMTARTRIGAALEMDSAELSCAVSLEGGFAPAVTTGFEAEVSEWLRLRAGAGYSPGKMSMGFGVGRPSPGWWPVVDVAWQWHPRLGVSSFVSITFEM